MEKKLRCHRCGREVGSFVQCGVCVKERADKFNDLQETIANLRTELVNRSSELIIADEKIARLKKELSEVITERNRLARELSRPI